MTNGAFFNGKTAKKHAVHASLAGRVLIVRDNQDETLVEWPLAEISAVYDDTKKRLARLTIMSDPDAALTLDDQQLFARLKPYLAKAPRNRSDYGFEYFP